MRLIVLLGLSCTAMAASAGMVEHAQREQVAGIDVVTYRTEVKDVVVVVGALPAGDAFAGTGNAAVPTLTSMMLDRGTRKLDQFTIARQLEGVGAEISFGAGPQSLEVRAKCLKKDLPLVIALIADELREPAFTAVEFDKAKQQFIGAIESSLQSTGARAQEAFARAVFAPGNPNRPHTLEEFIAAAKAATLDEVKAFHASNYGPAHFTLVVVGDVSMASARPEIENAFAGWTGGHDYLTSVPAATTSGPNEIHIPLQDKTSVSVLLGQATGLRHKDADSLALGVGTAILGRGFTGRLMATVRDKEGLTYDIGAGIIDDTLVGGAWQLSASFAPSLLSKGVAASRREVQTWWQDGITDTELAQRKRGIIGGYQVGLSTTGGLAGTILATIQRGYDLNWLDAYPKAVNALTVGAVNTAIKAHLDPSKMVLVEAGSLGAAK